MSTTYTKLKSGDWGLRTTSAHDLEPGNKVEVTTKAGAKKTETVGARVWSGDDRDGNKVTLFAIQAKKQANAAPPSSHDDWDSDGGEFA